MLKWEGHVELSLDKERAKRVPIYYAYPQGQRYGYFTSTREDVWRAFLAERNKT